MKSLMYIRGVHAAIIDDIPKVGDVRATAAHLTAIQLGVDEALVWRAILRMNSGRDATERKEDKLIDKIVRRLNEQHRMYSAGFYAPLGGLGRYFRARRKGDLLQVYDYERWYDAPADTVFSDHNGREIT